MILLTAPENAESCDHAKALRSLELVYQRRFKQQLAAKKSGFPVACGPFHEEPLVSSDDVCITVLELEAELQPEYLFSGIFGVIEPPQAWSIHSFHFAKPFEKPAFYHRDQLVPSGMPLHTLSINYSGDLSITADRMAIFQNGQHWLNYRKELGQAADAAFRTMPDLAIQLACEILTGDYHGFCSIAFELKPADETGADAYRAAFNVAWRILDPSLPADKTIYPCDNQKDISLAEELGLVPFVVKSPRTRDILIKSGAFKDVHAYADTLLIATRRSARRSLVFPGFNKPSVPFCHRCIQLLLLCATTDFRIPKLNGIPKTTHLPWGYRRIAVSIPKETVFAGSGHTYHLR